MGSFAPLLLAALVASSSAGPAGLRSTCSTSCSNSRKFSFERGMSYEYDYKIQSTTSNSPKNFDEQAEMIINSKVKISVLAPCEFVLTISDVNVEDASPSISSDMTSALSTRPLRFAFDDGRISGICGHDQEEDWAMNFKRGILSAFQNTMTTFDKDQTEIDVDVTGECETTYNAVDTDDSDSFLIERVKSSSTCRRMPVSSITTLPHALQKLPFLSADQKCQQKITAGITQEVNCEDVLIMKSISNTEGGATTSVTSKLTLTSVKGGVENADYDMNPSSLEYAAKETPKTTDGHLYIIETILRDLEENTLPVVSPEVPRLFSQLVENLKFLDTFQMHQLYESNKLARSWKFLVDAAPLVGTAPSTIVMSDLVTSGFLSQNDANAWFASLSLISSPSVEMFPPLTELLQKQRTKDTIFGVSSVIKNYCNTNPHCMEESSVRELSTAIEIGLGGACRSSSLEEKENVLITLYAQGNAGHFVNKDVLTNCFTERENPSEVRVAALDTWRKSSCSYDRSQILSLYSNSNEDSEIRISSYLALMACPSEEVISVIKDRLQSEGVNQVGSFVWTHLSNLQETASHDKQWIRNIIGEEMLVQKFNTTLKMSRNFESSFYMDELGFGSTIDSNVIFSGKSFLPRSAMFNFSLDIFGESLNLLEIGGRFEGFEIFAEKFFGPNGYYPQETVEGIIKGLRGSQQETSIEHMLDVVSDEPEGSYYVKLMGDNILYHHFRGVENFFEKKPKFNFFQMISDLAKKGTVDYTSSYKLIDTELVYPTIAGLPLSLKLNSTATLGIRVDGKMIMTSFSNMDVDGHIYPSSAVDLDATMLFDAHYSKSGIKIASNIHATSFIDGKIKIVDRNIVDIAVNFPKEKMQIFNVEVERVFIENSVERTDDEIIEGEKEQCFKTFPDAGMSFCSSALFTNNAVKLSSWLKKTDSHTGYVFRFMKESNSLNFLIDTPGSTIDRRMSLTAVLDENEARLDIYTPWKSFYATGTIVQLLNGRSIQLQGTSDYSKYQLSIDYVYETNEMSTTFTPSLKITTPNGDLVDLKCAYERDDANRRLSISVENKGILPLFFKASSTCSDELKTLSASVNSGLLTGSMSSKLQTGELLSTSVDAKYKFMNQPEQSFNHFFKLDSLKMKDESSVSTAFMLQASQLPHHSINAKAKAKIAEGNIEVSGSFNYGGDRFDLSTENTLSYLFNAEEYSYDTRVTLNSKSHHIDVLFTENFKLYRNSFLREAFLRLTPTFEMRSKTDVGYNKDIEGHARIHFTFPNMDLAQEVSFVKIATKYYTGQVLGHFNDDRWNINLSYQDQSETGKSIDVALGAKSNINDNRSEASLNFKADNQFKSSLEASWTNRGSTTFAKLKTTPTSIELDTNIAKSVYVKAEVDSKYTNKMVLVSGKWNRDQYPVDFSLRGELTSDSISGAFLFGSMERSFTGLLSDNGVSLNIVLAPQKEIRAKVEYSTDAGIHLSTQVETPFASFERQAVTVFFVGDKESRQFNSQVDIIWKNEQLLSFVASGSVNTLSMIGKMDLSASFVAKKHIFGVEQILFNLRHAKENSKIDSSVSGTIDGNEVIKGVFKRDVSPNYRETEATFLSPITEVFTYKSSYEPSKRASVNVAYGRHFDNLELEFIPMPQDAGGIVKGSLTTSFTNPLTFTLTYERSETRDSLKLEGSYGEKKCAVSVSLDKEMSMGSKIFSVQGRALLPNMSPITGSVNLSVTDGQKIVVEGEMTRFWASSGNVKLHSDLTITALSNIALITTITTPDSRISLESAFKYESNDVETYCKYIFNGVQQAFTVKGHMNPIDHYAKLRGSIVKDSLSLFKFFFEHKHEKQTQITKLNIKTTENTFDAEHQLVIIDGFNWNNKIQLNKIVLSNDMQSIGNTYFLTLDWNFGRRFINGKGEVTLRDFSKNINVDSKLELLSSWTEDLNAEVHYESDEFNYKPRFNINYGKFFLSSSGACTLLPEEGLLVLNTTSSFMEPSNIKIRTDLLMDAHADVDFSYGSHNSHLVLRANWNNQAKQASLEIDSSAIKHPIKVEVGVQSGQSETIISLEMKITQTYKAIVSFTNLHRNGKIEVTLDFPCISTKSIVTSLQYDCRTLPAVVNISYDANDESGNLLIKMSRNMFSSEVNVGTSTFGANAKWSGDENARVYEINAYANEKHVQVQLEYNLSQKKLSFTVFCNSINVLRVYLEIQPRYMGICQLKYELFNHICEINIISNEKYIKFSSDIDSKLLNVDLNFDSQYEIGDYSIEIQSTFDFLKNGTASLKYNFIETMEAHFEVTAGDAVMQCNFSAKAISRNVSQVIFEIKSTFDEYRLLSATLDYNFTNPNKSVSVELLRNDERLSWKFYILKDANYKGKLTLLLESTNPDYLTAQFGIEYDYTSKSYKINVYKEITGVRQEYELALEFGAKTVAASVIPGHPDGIKIEFNALLDASTEEIKLSAYLSIGEDAISLECELMKNIQSPTLRIRLITPYSGYETIELNASMNVNTGKFILETRLQIAALQYSFSIRASHDYNTTNMSVTLKTPTPAYSSLVLAFSCNISNAVKEASAVFERNGKKEIVSAKFNIGDSNVMVQIETPFERFETITFRADFVNENGRRLIKGTALIGKTILNISGELLSTNSFSLRSETPDHLYGFIEINGQKTDSGYELIVKRNTEVMKFVLNYLLQPTHVSVQLQTPFASMKNILFNCNFQTTQSSFELETNAEKDELKFGLVAKGLYTGAQGSLNVNVNLPYERDEMQLRAKFDVASQKKIADVYVKFRTYEDRISLIAYYEESEGSLSLFVPIIKKQFGASYTFNNNPDWKNFTGRFEAMLGSATYIFSTSSIIDIDNKNIDIQIRTPFESFNQVRFQVKDDIPAKVAQGKLIFGTYETTLDIWYDLKKPLLQIVSPFEFLRFLKLQLEYEFSHTKTLLSAVANFNQNSYEATFHYDPLNTDETVLLNFMCEPNQGKLSLGWSSVEKKLLLNFFAHAPLLGYNAINWKTNINLSSEDKVIDITYEMDGITIVSLSGRFVGANDLADIRIVTPFEGYENFRTTGSFSRSKRSLSFEMMNDSSSGSIIASFNSVNVVVKSPYPSLREATLKIESPDEGGLTIDYKRADNHFTFNASPSGKKQTFDVKLESAFPGWEMLALFGRLDKDEFIGYISGQVNEKKMTISGGGTYSRRESSLKFAITTPYAGYENVKAELSFNTRRTEFDLNISSSTSDFRIIVKSKPNLTVDIYVPNPAEPTIITANLTLMKGSIKVSSRFERYRSFNAEYNLTLNKKGVEANSKISWNGVEIFSLEFLREKNKAHFKLEARRGSNHSMIHFHRIALESMEFVFHRNSKEFKVEAQGTGNLPTKGSIDVVINNSFREEPRTISAHLDLDRSGSPKTAKLEITFPGSKLYVFNLSYNIDLSNTQFGDYELNIITPNRRAYPWQNLSGKWNLMDHNNVLVEFKIGRDTFIARGKVGLTDTDLLITSKSVGFEDIIIIYRLARTSTATERTRDYYLKVGRVSKFLLFSVKGRFQGIENGEGDHSFQLSRFMPQPLNWKVKWNRDSVNGLTGDGTFDYGTHSGTFRLNKLKRIAETRSLDLSWEATTNIAKFNKIKVDGRYSFNNEAVIKLDIVWDTDRISVDINVFDITKPVTSQRANFILPGIGDVDVTFGHDFSKKLKTYIIIAKYKDVESHLKAEWNANKDHTKLAGKIDIKTVLLGQIDVKVNWDVRNINYASAEIAYTRNDDKNVHIQWRRKYDNSELDAEILFESHFTTLPKARIAVTGKFTSDFSLVCIAEGAGKQVKLSLAVQNNSINGEFTSPFRGFERVTGTLTYNVRNPNKKSVSIRYKRGDKEVKMDLNIDIQSSTAGTLTLSLETPFELVRTLNMDANWANGQGTVNYRRNDISYSFTGRVKVKTDEGASFEIEMTPVSNEPVKIAFHYNPGAIIPGGVSEPQEIADVELEMLGKKIEFDLKGMRNSDRIFIDLEVESTFEQLQKFEFKLDSELNVQKRQGLMEITVNDFHFKIKNNFESKSDGFYFRSEIDSTLTSLPGIIIGFGREGSLNIFTVGVGEDREITVAIAGKENYHKGFSGKISLPRRGIVDAAIDVNYSFSGSNVLNADVSFELEPGKLIKADIVYNSDGVRARWTSPRTGRHNIRARRSISESSFMAEIGVDDYSVGIRGDWMNASLKKGFTLGGEILGHSVSLDTSFEAEGSKFIDGKFIIATTFSGYEKIGGVITVKNQNNQLHGNVELNLPLLAMQRVAATFDVDMNKKLRGTCTLDLCGLLYSFDIDITGDFDQGVTGQIVIRTPYSSEITITGEIKTVSLKKLSTAMTIQYPRGNCSFLFNLDLNAKILLETKLMSQNPMHQFYFKLGHSPQTQFTSLDLSFNGIEVTAEVQHKLPNISAKCDVNAVFLAHPIIILFNKEFTSVSLSVTAAGMRHNASGKYEIDERNLNFSVLLDSPFISNKQMLSMKHMRPLNYLKDSFSAELLYTGQFSYDCSLIVKRETGFRMTIEVQSPSGISNIDFVLEDWDRNANAGFDITLPSSQHKLMMSMTNNIVRNANDLLTSGFVEVKLDIISTLLRNSIKYKGRVEMDEKGYNTEQFVQIGEELHKLIVGYYYKYHAGKVIIDIETPEFGIGKASISGDIAVDDAFKFLISASHKEETHDLKLDIDYVLYEFTLMVNSPYIPGEVVKVNAGMKGLGTDDVQFATSLRMNDDVYATTLTILIHSASSVSTAMEIITPLNGYRKMNFGASYDDSDGLKAEFYSVKPFNFRLTLVSEQHESNQSTALEIITPVQGFEKVSAILEIPKNKMAPKVLVKVLEKEYGLDFLVANEKFAHKYSANLNLDGLKYGGGIGLRTKAPYELSYNYRVQQFFRRFHIMMDSSFLSFFSLLL